MMTNSSPAASPNERTIRGIYDGFASGNVPAVLAALDPGIVWNEAENYPYADGNPYIGPDAVLKGVFARCGSEWDGFAVVVEQLIDAGDAVIATGRHTGTYKATGRAQRTQFVHIWRLRGGKAIAFQEYADTLHVARVIGKA